MGLRAESTVEADGRPRRAACRPGATGRCADVADRQFDRGSLREGDRIENELGECRIQPPAGRVNREEIFIEESAEDEAGLSGAHRTGGNDNGLATADQRRRPAPSGFTGCHGYMRALVSSGADGVEQAAYVEVSGSTGSPCFDTWVALIERVFAIAVG